MKKMQLQDLLAPTWQEREQAEKRLYSELLRFPDDIEIWPREVQDEISRLKPSPEIFLSALLAFWADVADQQYQKRMEGLKYKHKEPPSRPENWASPHLVLFPMTPGVPPDRMGFMCGMSIWTFIAKLGPYAGSIENQLLACLRHPEPLVSSCVERAIGTADCMSDAGFAKLLASADRSSQQGNISNTAQVVAKHTQSDRIAMMLDGLEPKMPKVQSNARFEIIGKLTGESAQTAHQYLLQRIDARWSNEQLFDFIRALTHLSEKTAFDAQSISQIKRLASHPYYLVRCAVAYFLASHSPEEHCKTLKLLANDSKPAVLFHLCDGLAKHAIVPTDLLRAAVAKSLGNYDCCDNLPHSSAVNLLVKMGENAQAALPEILAWWESASNDHLEYYQVEEAMDIADALGEEGIKFKAGFERALIAFTADEEDGEEEVECPARIPSEITVDINGQINKAMEASGMAPVNIPEINKPLGVLLDGFSSFLDFFQEALDAQKDDVKAEQHMLEEGTRPDADEDIAEEEHHIIVRLRKKIAALDDWEKKRKITH